MVGLKRASPSGFTSPTARGPTMLFMSRARWQPLHSGGDLRVRPHRHRGRLAGEPRLPGRARARGALHAAFQLGDGSRRPNASSFLVTRLGLHLFVLDNFRRIRYIELYLKKKTAAGQPRLGSPSYRRGHDPGGRLLSCCGAVDRLRVDHTAQSRLPSGPSAAVP